MRRILATTLAGVAALVATLTPAFACGGLVAPNGAIRLTRAATLVAWHGGIEHYMTSFSYQGSNVKDFGWIVPLPAVPLKVEEGGGWTLQRLFRATHVLNDEFLGAAIPAAAAKDQAVVIEQVQIRALDITVLRGSGQAVVDWCRQNGFVLPPETRAHLLVYAHGSPVFMAAKYNVARAEATGQLAGDGAPVLITMKLARPWIPLEVLSNGVDNVGADLYLLSDTPVYLSDLAADTGTLATGGDVPGALGMHVVYQDVLDASLFHDLSTDKNMGWVWPGGILTYIALDAPAKTVTYDLGVTDRGVIRLAAYGTAPERVGAAGAVPGRAAEGWGLVLWVAACAAVLGGYLAAWFALRRYLQAHS